MAATIVTIKDYAGLKIRAEWTVGRYAARINVETGVGADQSSMFLGVISEENIRAIARELSEVADEMAKDRA